MHCFFETLGRGDGALVTGSCSGLELMLASVRVCSQLLSASTSSSLSSSWSCSMLATFTFALHLHFLAFACEFAFAFELILIITFSSSFMFNPPPTELCASAWRSADPDLPQGGIGGGEDSELEWSEPGSGD